MTDEHLSEVGCERVGEQTPGGDPRRGWTVEGYDSYGVPRRLDIHIVDEWTARGRRCVLLEVTRFFLRHYGAHRRHDTIAEEKETVYKGGVHVPELNSVLGGYSYVRPSRLEADSDWKADWTWTTAADDLEKPGIGYDTLAGAMRAKTTKLARGIARHHKEELET